MLKGLLKNKSRPIGLDIGTDSIKMLQMQQSGQVLSVLASGCRSLGRIGCDPGERREASAEAIREMLQKGRFVGRRVVSALPSSQLEIRNVRIAPLPPQELDEAIRWEAGERFNFEVGPDQLKWINAGQVRQGDEIRDEIVMIAAPAEAVEEHLELLGSAGLVPEHVEAEPVALFRIFQHFLRRRDDEQAVSVIVDMGKGATRVTVARGPKIVFVKRIDIGGAKLTEAVAKQLNLSYEQAHELRIGIMKDQAGKSERSNSPEEPEKDQSLTKVDWTIQDAMRGDAEELAHEVSLCLRYCSVTFRGLRPGRVVLTGGEAYDRGLVRLLAENLNLECVVGRPLRGVDVSRMEVAANRRGTLAEWAVCAGLAMQGLCREEPPRETDDAEHRLSA